MADANEEDWPLRGSSCFGEPPPPNSRCLCEACPFDTDILSFYFRAALNLETQSLIAIRAAGRVAQRAGKKLEDSAIISHGASHVKKFCNALLFTKSIPQMFNGHLKKSIIRKSE